MTVSVAIIEDDAPVRDLLAGVIRSSSQCTLVGTAKDRAQSLLLIAEDRADVYVVDLGLPDIDGVDLITRIRSQCRSASCLVHSGFGDAHHVMRSLQAGARGYLLKGEVSTLVDRIVTLHNGASPLSPAVARVLIDRLSDAGLTRGLDGAASRREAIARFGLGRREMEALELLAAGLTIAQIADRMAISTHTANQHLRHIYRKLDVHSRAKAVSKALQEGLLTQ